MQKPRLAHYNVVQCCPRYSVLPQSHQAQALPFFVCPSASATLLLLLLLCRQHGSQKSSHCDASWIRHPRDFCGHAILFVGRCCSLSHRAPKEHSTFHAISAIYAFVCIFLYVDINICIIIVVCHPRQCKGQSTHSLPLFNPRPRPAPGSSSDHEFGVRIFPARNPPIGHVLRVLGWRWPTATAVLHGYAACYLAAMLDLEIV